MDNYRAFMPLIIFVILLSLAIAAGNGLLVFVMQRPLDKIPFILQFIVHGITLGFFAVLAKKYFLK
jgi:uncharacterized membrane protein (DUF106 family)